MLQWWQKAERECMQRIWMLHHTSVQCHYLETQQLPYPGSWLGLLHYRCIGNQIPGRCYLLPCTEQQNYHQYSSMHILQRVTHSRVFVLTGSVPSVRHPNWRQATLASLAPKLASVAVPYLFPLDKTSRVPEHPLLRRIWLPQDGAQLPNKEFWRLSRSGAATTVKDSFNLRHWSMVAWLYALAKFLRNVYTVDFVSLQIVYLLVLAVFRFTLTLIGSEAKSTVFAICGVARWKSIVLQHLRIEACKKGMNFAIQYTHTKLHKCKLIIKLLNFTCTDSSENKKAQERCNCQRHSRHILMYSLLLCMSW